MRIGISLTSSLKVAPEYIDLTHMVAASLAHEGFGVVFGGTDYGMMGELAKSYKDNGGKDLVGVIAKDLMKVTKGYKAYSNLDEKFLVPTMEDRKRKIVELSNGFIILPGGYGTLEELGIIVGGKANKLFDKPIAIYNYKGFYDKFIEFLKYMTEKSFSKIALGNIVLIEDDINNIINYFKEYKPISLPDKFID
ncbi:Rossman fold protein, TIGR00730 family [Candidatus Roizmanbacteria bacterium RIFCSPLOWO2_02_FULL_37_19]|uniref:Cytokinin riboside 5'-monophosphate phosphoribohydrolase n=1 Tax=Candidatus Roizmanbacteria bacterium RIFCSPHIGHO2_02_FULL_37_24 TaxID=1802037 RepID=A0A1F7H0U6_9BACT|nr:MAG: Rossman fold protein, TIGR00730 family [Candidatus Roizmanbacteria bacterium RIFCSPHIGHO2_01_FULL_38_41]OGK24554.1 MAG: Rossman fold protein, TIGR00730 family [Candidatus Roizmanbacteria bacterium RIFCSPHIGHO2_02_FULL_37_24]OGK32008.1 MAG: Rossman fold protein, TIGR00730 family [Candidatus Roizmanbacteria bacterium RIFCSPHIGHO2_12_FULL_37_23]OGK54363.1 MAG: Rossman fold protein, TIGR00730 family [Candidatus Roizmanbacteria bacterium RIFCSPLOWO2_02_FULL_37_19]